MAGCAPKFLRIPALLSHMSRLKLVACGAALGLAGFAAWWNWHDPQTPAQHFAEALAILEGEGNPARVETALRALDGQPEFSRHVALLEGLVQLRARRPEQALARLRRAQSEPALLDTVRVAQAEALYQLGRLTEAESLLQQVLEEQPDHLRALRWLAAIYYDLGANDYAIRTMRRVIELDARDYRPYRLIGMMHRDFDQNGEAIPEYERALELNPPPNVREEVVRELAEALIAQHHYDRALELLEQAQPDATVLCLKAQALWTLGRAEEAEQHLEDARRLEPELRAIRLLDADIRLARKDYAGARTVLRQALATDPHDAECRYLLTRVLQQMGNEQEYAMEVEKWNASQKLAERRTLLSIEAIKQPRNAEIRDELARICDELGRRELAEMWRQAAQACRQAMVVPQAPGS